MPTFASISTAITPFNLFFCALITILFLIALLTKREHLRSNMPNMLVSIGIFGTFLGVISGLSDFDPSDIDASIPALLNGLKTAFGSSLFGMLGSIALNFIFHIQKDNATQETHFTEKDLFQIFQSQQNTQQEILKVLNQISNKDETPLLSQVQALRTDLHDQYREKKIRQHNFQTKLWTELKDFSEMMSKSATEQVINALKEVIRDFNQNLTEQFGENFKELNQAVILLVQWQENYKQQLQLLEKQFQKATESIEKTEQAISNIAGQTQKIPETMQKLETILESNQEQIKKMWTGLASLSEIRNKAEESIKHTNKHIKNSMQKIEKLAGDMMTQLDKSSQSIQSDLQKTSTNITEASDLLISQNKLVTNKLDQQVQAVLKGLEKNIQQTLSDTAESIQKEVKMLDEVTRKRQEEELSRLGSALASISQKFTSDYKILVNEMNRVIRTHSRKEEEVRS